VNRCTASVVSRKGTCKSTGCVIVVLGQQGPEQKVPHAPEFQVTGFSPPLMSQITLQDQTQSSGKQSWAIIFLF